MNIKPIAVAACILLATTACKKTADNKPNFTAAINRYYASRPACLFPDPVKFPAQADTKDQSKTSPYDALVDQGLLTRSTAEKKEMIVLSKQVTNYDLSDKGRSAWTADQQQPGFGNFCYGTRTVSSMDCYTPMPEGREAQPGDTTTVTYHGGISNPPGWASAPQTQHAYPQLRSDLANGIASATLTDTSSGWSVTNGPAGTARHPASNADGSIVQ